MFNRTAKRKSNWKRTSKIGATEKWKNRMQLGKKTYKNKQKMNYDLNQTELAERTPASDLAASIAK